MSSQSKYESKHRQQARINSKRYFNRHRKVYKLYKQGKLIKKDKVAQYIHIYKLYKQGKLVPLDKAKAMIKKDKVNIDKSDMLANLYAQGELLTRNKANHIYQNLQKVDTQQLNDYKQKMQKYINFYNHHKYTHSNYYNNHNHTYNSHYSSYSPQDYADKYGLPKVELPTNTTKKNHTRKKKSNPTVEKKVQNVQQNYIRLSFQDWYDLIAFSIWHKSYFNSTQWNTVIHYVKWAYKHNKIQKLDLDRALGKVKF